MCFKLKLEDHRCCNLTVVYIMLHCKLLAAGTGVQKSAQAHPYNLHSLNVLVIIMLAKKQKS